MLLVLFAAIPALAVMSAPSAHAAPVGSSDFGWPLSPEPTVVRRFELPEKRWLAGHRGVDLAAPSGSVVRSAGAGVVNFAGLVAGKPVVSVRHADGLLTTYEPVTASVNKGAVVARGSPIGVLDAGHGGCRSPCLHWGARRGTGSSAQYLDPLALLGEIRVRLKPLAASR
jgi:murein DD-endopeptidase MepM/ murein hydrolase activator NlpD